MILGRVSFTKEEARQLIRTAEAYWSKNSELQEAKKDVVYANNKAERAKNSATEKENQMLRKKLMEWN